VGFLGDLWSDNSSSAIAAAISKANQYGAKALSSHERGLLEAAARQAGETGRQARAALAK
jgi:hypothetical protein